MNGCEKFIMWCDRIMTFAFYALIYFLPISIALAETFTVMALVFFLLKRGAVFLVESKGKELSWLARSFSKNRIGFFLKCYKPVENCLNVPIAVFLLVSFISAIFSQRPTVSWPGFFGKTLQSAFLYFNFIECINSRKRLKIFLNVFFVSCLLICINSFYQGFIGQGFILGNYFDGRISSSLRHANDLAGYLVIVTPLLLSASLAYAAEINGIRKYQPSAISPTPFLSRRDTILSVILFIITLSCLGLTYSRGAWIGFLIAMLLLGLQRKRFMFINCLVLVLFFSIFYPRIQEYRSVSITSDVFGKKDKEEILIEKGDKDLLIRKARKLGSLGMEESGATGKGKGSEKGYIIQRLINTEPITSYVYGQWKRLLNVINSFGGSGRGAYWREALAMVKDYPLFGVGLNAYSLVAPRYKIRWGGYPHNCYLQMLGEIGVVGFLSFMWILLRIFKRGIKDYGRMHDLHLKMIFLGVMTGYTGFLIHSFFDTNFYSVQLGSLMWIVMGLFVVVPKVDSNNQEENTIQRGGTARRSVKHVSNFTIRICIFILALFVVFFCYIKRTSINSKYAKVFFKLGAQCANNCSHEKRVNYFKKALHYDPNLSDAYYELGILYNEAGDKKLALELYKKAAELDHTDWEVYYEIGHEYFKNKKFDVALRYFHQAHKYASTSNKLNFYLARIYEKRKEYRKAINFYQHVRMRSYENYIFALAREGALHHIVDHDTAARDQVFDLRDMNRDDLADQLEHFIKTDEMPAYMTNEDMLNSE